MVLLLWLACAPPIEEPPDTSTTPPVPVPAPEPTTPEPLTLTVERPNEDVYLYWELTTDSEDALEVRLTGDDGTSRVFVGAGRVPLAWLHADTAYTVEVSDGQRRGTTSFRTEPLPEPFPVFEVLVHDPEALGEGAWVVPVSHPDRGLLVVLDEALEPVWVGVRARPWYAVAWVGDRFVGVRGTRAHGVTLRGHWTVHDVAPELHHDVVVLDDGSWVALAASEAEVDAYPESSTACDLLAPALLHDSDVVHFDAADVELQRVAMVDVLQPSRCTWEGFLQVDGGYDWVHLNAVDVLPDGDVVVSSRAQSAVVRTGFDGELDWILANPSGWEAPWSEALLRPVGDVTWPDGQHSTDFDPATGLLTVFDNGGRRYTPYEEPPDGSGRYSRVVGYGIDEQAGTVEERWSWQPDPPLYAAIMGGADRLPSGQVLSAWTWLKDDGGVPAKDLGWGDRHTRLIQFTPGKPEPHLDLRIRSDRGDLPLGWWTFRAQRIDWADFGVPAPASGR